MEAWTSDEDGILLQEVTRGLRGYTARAHARLPHRTRTACRLRLARLRDCGRMAQPVKPWFPPVEKGRLPPGKAVAAKRLRAEGRWDTLPSY